MSLLDGKQLRDQSTGLGKLSGTGVVAFTTATMSFNSGSVLRTDTSNILTSTDVVNKEYVDSVAAGLDPKESVGYTTTGTITLSGTASQAGGDWTSLEDGQRVLVKNQTGATANGIYTAAAGAWTRATDSDGTPANEVSLGNFTFVEFGTYAGSGYVLYNTNSPSKPLITPNTDTQEWTLFSAAGSYTNGPGLDLTAGEFSAVAGTGITVSTAISIANTGVTAASYGGAGTVGTFTVNAQGQLTSATDVTIDITASQVSDFTTESEAAIFTNANFVDGTTIDFTVTVSDSVTAEVANASLTASHLNTGSNGGATAGYVLSVDGSGNFKWVLDEGDISEVTAGQGLTGGGTTGALTLDVNVDNGLSITDDYVGLGGTLSRSTSIAGANYDFSLTGVDYMTIDNSVFDVTSNFVSIDSGTGSTQLLSGVDTTISASSSINITANEGNVTTGNLEGLVYTADYSATFVDNSLITKKYFQDNISIGDITGVTAGAGLSGGGTAGDVQLDIEITAAKGLTFSTSGVGGTLEVAVDNTTIGFVDGQLVSLSTADITGVTAGAGLSGGGTTGDVQLDIELTTDKGLTFSTSGVGGTLEVLLDNTKGLTFSNGSIVTTLTTDGGLTFSNGSITTVVDGTTIQIVNGALSTVSGSAEPVYQYATGLTATDGNTFVTLDSTPNDYSRITVFVNGQQQRLTEDTSGDCYFGPSGTAFASLTDSSILYWNATNAGFSLSGTDKIFIQYEA